MVYALSALAGLRPGEALALTKSAVSRRLRQMGTHAAGSGASRSIDVPPSAGALVLVSPVGVMRIPPPLQLATRCP